MTLLLTSAPRIYYVGIAALISTLLLLCLNYYNHKKLLPEFYLRKAYFDLKCLYEIISSGLWNSLQSLGSLLLVGLDLLICNLFISPTAMGELALAKVIPSAIMSLNGSIIYPFAPKLIRTYAKGDKYLVLSELKWSCKLTGIIMTIPIGILMVFGDAFYSLWVPGQNSKKLQMLSLLTGFAYGFLAGVQPIYNVFPIVNRIKRLSLIVIANGVISALIVFILIKLTSLGIFAVAGVSTIIYTLTTIIFIVPLSAKYLHLKWSTFYPEIAKSVLSVCLIYFIGFIVKIIFNPSTWFSLIYSCSILFLISIALNCLLILDKNDRIKVSDIIKNVSFKIMRLF
jgi:O-antigen/teichoic acid export membrane protein